MPRARRRWHGPGQGGARARARVEGYGRGTGASSVGANEARRGPEVKPLASRMPHARAGPAERGPRPAPRPRRARWPGRCRKPERKRAREPRSCFVDRPIRRSSHERPPPRPARCGGLRARCCERRGIDGCRFPRRVAVKHRARTTVPQNRTLSSKRRSTRPWTRHSAHTSLAPPAREQTSNSTEQGTQKHLPRDSRKTPSLATRDR